jgi:hypothetical protein
MTRAFFDKFGQPIHEKLVELGAPFQLPERPLETVFAEEGYEQTGHVSIPKRAAELRQLPLLMRLYAGFSPVFANGYTIRTFAPVRPQTAAGSLS